MRDELTGGVYVVVTLLDGSTENVVRLIDHCDDHHASDAPAHGN